MTWIDFLISLYSDYTLRTVALGAVVLGIVSGALGSYAVLRRQSLLGDAISHAALPGIAIAFLITRTKSPLVLLLGAGVAGGVATLLRMAITRTTRTKDDSALGLVLSVFFGFGLMLLTFIQRMPDATQAGLDKFLFGQAATLLERDVIIMAALGGTALVLIVLLWKEWKVLSFDPDFAACLGFPVRALDIALTILLVVAIVIGLQTVGVVLMSAMVVAPAAAARQWTDRLGLMVILSAAFGAASGLAGAVISASTAHLPTGPTIVLCVGVLVLVSLFFAPNRGVVAAWLRHRRNARRLLVEAVLDDLYALALQHEGAPHGHPAAVLTAMNAGRSDILRSLHKLAQLNWARQVGPDLWALTAEGLEAGASRQALGRGQEAST